MRAIWRSAARTSASCPWKIQTRLTAPQIAVKLFGVYPEIDLASPAGGIVAELRERAPQVDGINQIGIRAFKQTARDAQRASFVQEVFVLEIGYRFRPANAVLRLYPPCKPTLAACAQPMR